MSNYGIVGYGLRLAAICAIGAVCWANAVSAQLPYRVATGQVAFESNAPLELIRATTTAIQGTIVSKTRLFAFKIPMQSFQGFNSALQRQHFNQNYVESAKYPNATFAGRIIEEVDLNLPGTYTVRAKGKLNIHGVEVERIIRARVVSNGATLTLNCTFEVPLIDHRIQVPTIVYQKVADVIRVRLDATLRP